MTAVRSSKCELLLLVAASVAGLAACSGRALILDGAPPASAVSTVDAGEGVVEKIPLPDDISAFWVDDTRLYWATQLEQIRSCLHEDCERTAITYGHSFGVTALGANDLYWSVAGEITVLACPKSGCKSSPTQVVQDPYGGRGAAADGDYYYWTSAFDIFRCPASGCGEIPELVASGESATNLQLAGSRVYWSTVRVASDDASTLTDIRSAPQDGSEPPTTVATLSNAGIEFAVDTRNLYWIDRSFHVQTCPLESCARQSPTALATSDHEKGPLVVDASGLYWREGSSVSWVVMFCPLAGCGSEPRALSSDHLVGTWTASSAFALDSTYVYWQELESVSGPVDTRSIHRMRKPTP
jgi:hypothetical protein